MFLVVKFFILTFLPQSILSSESVWPKEITLGLINSYYHPVLYELIVNVSINDLKSDGYMPQYANFKIYQAYGCDDQSSADAAFKIWFTYNVSVTFGPECSQGAAPVALMASSLNKPVIGYLSITSELANKTKYTTLSRVSYTASYMAQAIAATIVYHGWYSVAVIRSAGYPNCNIILSGIAQEFKDNNITISNDITVDFISAFSLKNALNILKMTARVVLICGGPSPVDAMQFLQAASDDNMMTNEYVYLTPYYAKQTLLPWEPWLATNMSKTTTRSSLRALYKNAIVIQTYGETTDSFKQFVDVITKTVNSDPNKFAVTNYTNDSLLKLGPLYDAIYLYGLILNESIGNGDGYQLDGRQMLHNSSFVDFLGVTGRVVMDDNGERVSNYYVMKMDETGRNFIAYLMLGSNETDQNSYDTDVLEMYGTPFWNTPDNSPPLTIPVCGFLDDLCPKYIISAVALAVTLPICILFLILSISFLVYIQKKKAFERQLLQLAWKIDLNHLTYISKQLIRGSFISSSYNMRQLEGDTNVSTSSSYGSVKSNGKFEGCGYYKDIMVAIKRWKRSANIVLHREHLLHLKILKEMNHENVNRFIGFSIDGGSAVLSVWVYCTKRSLQEIIFNEDIHLDANFQVSILRDIVSVWGLEYIHASPIGYHGRLFVHNCLVDGRWIVKLTDFGLQPILKEMKRQKAIELKEEEDMDKLLCTAPEILRFKSINNMKPADVYQYGMIMYQVLFREEPFADSDIPAADIVSSIACGSTTDVPFRPHIKTVKELDSRIHNLILICWQESHLNRPTIQEVKKELFASTKTFGKNLMDHVMSMLEKYATNLEKVVDERTQQLNEERKRADRLLYQMLPKSVADALKTGQTVQPETYDCVTIYFSDIVGFTTICGKSKPMEVVAMLNGLYSQFDEIILTFDAYKVETIGDAYLVVSGLPVRNGNRHVTNIADMSFKILEALKIFRIPHLPNEQLQIRIGIHSGPVAGGVVGLTMPKFCLFGDAVNFASRMESTGEAGKMHITENTKLMLDKYIEYVTVERGQIDIKGKGICTTFWLVHKLVQ